MSSTSLSTITERYPAERRALGRLERIAAEGPSQYTFENLFRAVGASSPEIFALILTDLARLGSVRRVFRVESPFTHRGLGDYETLDAIPDRIRDQLVEQEFTPTPSDIKTVYFIGQHADPTDRGGTAKRPRALGELFHRFRSWRLRFAVSS